MTPVYEVATERPPKTDGAERCEVCLKKAPFTDLWMVGDLGKITCPACINGFTAFLKVCTKEEIADAGVRARMGDAFAKKRLIEVWATPKTSF